MNPNAEIGDRFEVDYPDGTSRTMEVVEKQINELGYVTIITREVAQ